MTRPLVSRKGQRERKGNFKQNDKQVVTPVKKSKAGPSFKLSASTTKEMVAGSRITSNIWQIRRMAKVNKGIFDIHVIDGYLTSARSSPWVFDTRSVAKISNSKQELQNKWRLVEGEVTMSVGSGSKIDMIIIAHSLYFRD